MPTKKAATKPTKAAGKSEKKDDSKTGSQTVILETKTTTTTETRYAYSSTAPSAASGDAKGSSGPKSQPKPSPPASGTPSQKEGPSTFLVTLSSTEGHHEIGLRGRSNGTKFPDDDKLTLWRGETDLSVQDLKAALCAAVATALGAIDDSSTDVSTIVPDGIDAGERRKVEKILKDAIKADKATISSDTIKCTNFKQLQVALLALTKAITKHGKPNKGK